MEYGAQVPCQLGIAASALFILGGDVLLFSCTGLTSDGYFKSSQKHPVFRPALDVPDSQFAHGDMYLCFPSDRTLLNSGNGALAA